jgi:spore germination protein GerM
VCLSKDEEATYGSAILRGTRFLSLKIDSKGTATADFSSLLDKEIKDCARVQRQAQIEKTLESFPGVKNVVITVNGKAW